MKTLASMTVPATMDALRQAIAFVNSCTCNRGFDAQRMGEIELCLEEILVNIFHYAYPEEPGDVKIQCLLTEGGTFVIEVSDEGVPFDMLSTKDPNIQADIDDRPIGGLGIFFVKTLISDVRYRRENNKNILTLFIPLPPSVA